MFSILTSKIFGGLAISLALALAFVWITKGAEIGSLTKQNTALQKMLDRSSADLAQCRESRITLEDATSRQNAAVGQARIEGDTRRAALARTAAAAKADAATARARADAILARAPRTADMCADANALILESLR